MKKLILLTVIRDKWLPNNENMSNNFTGLVGCESEVIKEFNNLDDGLQALKKCVPVDYSYPGKIEIISYALSVYENDVMSDRYEWAYKKTEDGIVYKLEKTM